MADKLSLIWSQERGQFGLFLVTLIFGLVLYVTILT